MTDWPPANVTGKLADSSNSTQPVPDSDSPWTVADPVPTFLIVTVLAAGGAATETDPKSRDVGLTAMSGAQRPRAGMHDMIVMAQAALSRFIPTRISASARPLPKNL
jgi:hypothetical protein